MREFSLPLRMFEQGLRSESKRQLNKPGHVQCTGLRLADEGLEIMPACTNPFTDPLADMDWPFPQLFRFAGDTYLLTRHYIYLVNADWSLTVKAAWFHSGTHWDGFDFGEFVGFTNGTIMLINNFPTGDFRFALETEIPLAATACNFRGQIIVGNTALGGNWVQWSEIGANQWVPTRQNDAGMRQMQWAGDVLCVKPLGARTIVYGENGISALVPAGEPAVTFGLQEIAGYGLASVRAIGGDELVHVFVDAVGVLHRYKGETIENLGYQEFFGPMLGGNIVVLYNQVEEEFYISDGSEGYVLTKQGLTEGVECISGGAVFEGGFVGVSSSLGDVYRTVVSNPIDMGQRGEKTITMVKTSAGITSLVKVAVDWRWSQQSAFSRTPFFPINSEGVAHLPVAVVEFRIVLRFPTADSIDLTGDVVVGYQVSDKRAIRGVYVPASSDRGASE